MRAASMGTVTSAMAPAPARTRRPQLCHLRPVRLGSQGVREVEVRFGWRAPGGPSSAHRPVPVAALDSMGRLVSEVTARFVPFHEGRAGQLYVPEVPGAAAYRIETGGSPLLVDAVVGR